LGAESVFPDCAADVGLGAGVDLCAFAIDHCISFIALFADSLLRVELLAGALHFTADALAVEVVPVRALEAGVGAPNFAAEVVVELGEECSVVKLIGCELGFLGSEWCD